MIIRDNATEDQSSEQQRGQRVAELAHLSAAGQQFARTLAAGKRDGQHDKDARAGQRQILISRNHVSEVRRKIEALLAAHAGAPEEQKWLTDHYRLLRTTLRESRNLGYELRELPAVASPRDSLRLPRAFAIAQEYLTSSQGHFSEDGLTAFLAGFQSETELRMSEIWALKPSLAFALLERIVTDPGPAWPALLTSLRLASEANWKDLFETASVVDHVLRSAPGSEYGAMDYESRDLYRNAVTSVAQFSVRTERDVAEMAVRLASQGAGRRACPGYYLIDEGAETLRQMCGWNPPLMEKIRQFVLRYPNGFYLVGIEVVTLAIVYALLSRLETLTPIVAGFFLLLLPATQAAVDFMNNLVSYLLKPRVLPRLDFSGGVPEECSTLVAVPTLLINDRQVRDLILDLEIRYLANRDPNVRFALVTDSPDSDQPVDERDALVEICQELIAQLNARYGSGAGDTPFYMLHRHRVFNPSEGRWMGWERKRGKLLDLNQLLRGGFDSFPVKVGNTSRLSRIRYVITLDSDTQLPRDSAAKLVGTMAHPLNQPVLDPHTRMVIAGYGILQPRIGVSIQSSVRSRLAALYSGQTGFDIYTRAISDAYQDLFGEGIFTGKGIYDVDAVHASVGQRFPENALLSHDLIEGAYARAGLVSDIELIDDYPSHFSAYSRRKHRWVRGDWQITRWLLPRVPDFHGEIIANPISLISRWKILDNLRRSLFEPATLALFLAGWFYLPGSVWHWTGASLAMWFMPVWAGLLFGLLRAPVGSPMFGAWAREWLKSAIQGHTIALLGVIFLLHQALLSLDAIVRSLLRTMVTRRRLLEWETAAEAENASTRRATVDIYLTWTPILAATAAAALWITRPSSTEAAAPILALWFVSRWVSGFLNRAPRGNPKTLSEKDAELLQVTAERILRFYDDWSSDHNHWLIPDNVTEDGAVADRLSPTNAGFLLNARLVGYLLGKYSLQEFATKTRLTLATLEALPKYRGHLLNWYDNQTLRLLEPRFVSTVDSGNLVACLWTLKQAALQFAGNSEDGQRSAATPEQQTQLREIAASCERLAGAMDFSFLFDARKKLLRVGYDVATGRLEPSSYDLLASESRIACFVAIAMGQIPQEAWFHLGRRHTLARGARVLVSWTGTMFEYLMPALWMRHYPGTILNESLSAMLRVQREYARTRGVPWGVSESACSGGSPDADYGYAAFGVPELGMKKPDSETLVISPYSTFLALSVDPKSAMQNLRRMADFGWSGRYGFYEAVDYCQAGGAIVRSWMAHHQGMSLLAICNALLDNPLHRFFHAEPRVMATELLLHERVPSTVHVEVDEAAMPAAASPGEH